MPSPQNVQRIDHVAFVYYRENLAKIIDQFQKPFGISNWDGPTEMPQLGMVQAQSLSAGIEIMSPLDSSDNSPFSQHLRTKGEGFFALVFGVADLRASAERAAKQGIKFKIDERGDFLLIDSLVSKDGGPAHASWAEKLHRYDEYWLEPMLGDNFLLSQIEPRK